MHVHAPVRKEISQNCGFSTLKRIWTVAPTRITCGNMTAFENISHFLKYAFYSNLEFLVNK